MLAVTKITEGCFRVAVGEEDMLFGCPSEIVKVFMRRNEKMPRTIVLPTDFYRGGIVQANLEFPVYYFLFVLQGWAKGEKLKVVGTPDQLARIKKLLDLTVLGPSYAIMHGVWKIDVETAHSQVRIADSMALKCKDGNAAELDDFIEFIPFKKNGEVMLDGMGGFQVHIVCRDRNMFDVIIGDGNGVRVDLNFTGHQAPPIPIAPAFTETKRPAFGAIALSKCTSGFDPSGYTTGFLLWINSMALMVDGVPWTKDHLRSLGVNSSEIQAYVLSHVHEDHASIMETIINGKMATLITTDEVYQAFLSKAACILGWSEERVAKLIKFIRVVPGEPLYWYGATFRFFRTVHVISTVGFTVEYQGRRIVYSGDTMWGSNLKKLFGSGVVTEEQFLEVSAIPLLPSDLTIMDGAGGAIHADPNELDAALSWEQKERTFLTHRSSLPPGVSGLKTIQPGMQWEIIPSVSWTVGDVNVVMNSPIISGLDEGWKGAVLSFGNLRNVSSGSILLKEGCPGKNFYVILGGAFAVNVNDAGEVATLGTGDFFGEFSIMRNAGCSATVTAISNGRILEIPREVFLEMAASTELGRRLKKIHNVRPILMRCGLIKDLPAQVVNRMIDRLAERKYSAGEKIIQQGEPGSEFFIIKSGRIRIFVEPNGLAEKDLAVLSGGQFFGEMALLEGGKRSASAMAETDTEVLVLDQVAFAELIHDVPTLNYVIGILADERSAEQR